MKLNAISSSMIPNPAHIAAHNEAFAERHARQWAALKAELPDANAIADRLSKLNIAIPSWALGSGGTRFGRYPGGGEPRNLDEKLEEVATLHRLTGACGAISLHIPWDAPGNAGALMAHARALGIGFDAVNANTFQDQPTQTHSYRFGSLHHTDAAVRAQAVRHHLEVIQTGVPLGSKALTVWLADGSSHPGQLNFREAYQRTLSSLTEIYAHLPHDWTMLVEYKPFEPHFYSMTIADWGQALMLCESLGPQAKVLVDLGHHLPGTNIEQIVALLLLKGRLGGFHFNDSRYADDDLTAGSLKPFQLYLICLELAHAHGGFDASSQLAWMIDASHNLKDPLEDLLQSLEAIQLAWAQALCTDQAALAHARQSNDPVLAQEILQHAFRCDLRPLLAEARLRNGAALQPIALYRSLGLREARTNQRGRSHQSTGL